MEVTFLGYIALILTLYVIFFKRSIYFLYFAIVFSGFSGSSVINVLGVSVQPSYYFFIIYFISRLFKSQSIKLDWSLSLFLFYCIISIVFPLIYEKERIILMDQSGKYTELRFSYSNIIHVLYLLMDVLFLSTLLKYKGNRFIVSKFVGYFKIGLWLVIIVCLYQLAAFQFGLEFDRYFRQSVHGNVQGTRLYGPCIEASMLSYYLIPAIFIVAQNTKDWKDTVLIVAAIIIGLISRSSTFLIGLILFIIFLIPKFFNVLGKKQGRFLGGFIVFFISAFLVAAISSGALITITQQFIDKINLNALSGIERWDTFLNMSLIGIRYPTGIGFGSGRSKDLLSTWLCNIGLIGVCLFFVFIFRIVYFSVKQRKVDFSIPTCVVVILMFSSVPEPYNLFVWYVFFYSLSNICMGRRKTIRLKDIVAYRDMRLKTDKGSEL